MYANGRNREAKVRGAGGVARSKGKEHLFRGSDSGILSVVNVGEMRYLIGTLKAGYLNRKRVGYP